MMSLAPVSRYPSRHAVLPPWRRSTSTTAKSWRRSRCVSRGSSGAPAFTSVASAADRGGNRSGDLRAASGAVGDPLDLRLSARGPGNPILDLLHHPVSLNMSVPGRRMTRVTESRAAAGQLLLSRPSSHETDAAALAGAQYTAEARMFLNCADETTVGAASWWRLLSNRRTLD